MAAPKGNEFWKCRAKHGPNYRYEGEEGAAALLGEVEAYLTWCSENPLQEERVFCYKGEISRTTVDKMRVATIGGLCLYLGITPPTWDEWSKRQDLSSVIVVSENAIRQYKLAGASADLLNANIISRLLGLADKREVSGPGGGPIRQINSDMSPEDAADAYAATRLDV